MSSELFSDQLESPVGTVRVIAGPAGVRRVGWQLKAGDAATSGRDPTLGAALRQLREYFAGERQVFELPMDLVGLVGSTRTVLLTLVATVGYGQTISYGELAARSGSGVPARAIGSIMGANPLPLIIPCHRVVAHDGLGGYSGGDPGCGLETKRRLLELEGAMPPTLPL
ncbi:hypothetical protein GCM10009841_14080 [Microlunatus panaciterrae]|uniref:Methylated-DNA--protein-cysteine methyltransferase n=1 Tax=Microlunatus panaciterrae TaxID=400768 RepID=A0ABS2RPW1_9ACTN|nr:methylated-DNA--[protein]-cysteine S-methyltransferase [Microlunatus panaciterrae]MBM7799969.1 methylated-DNA-[protein]-cysteine S-methyltransferase [Microlunatus panaciterrae]